MMFNILFLFTFCLILAYIEVQIEGPHGWAKNLPTWKPFDNKWYVRFYKKITHGKILTGYHLGINFLVLFGLHGFYFYNNHWSWQLELQVWSLYFLVAVIWDFLWFVLNPHYGWKNFKPAKIAWHKSWLGPWPIDYYYGLLLFIIFYVFSLWPYWYLGLGDGLILLVGMLILTMAATLVRVVIDNRKNFFK